MNPVHGRPRILAVEGIDGAGKSVSLAGLAARLGELGRTAPVHTRYDRLLFDRWLPTHDVHADGTGRHDAHYRQLTGRLPRPDVLLHLTVAPAVAQARIRPRDDWTADHWSAERLRADLERLDAASRREFAGRTDVVTVDGEGSPGEVCSAVLALMGVGVVAVRAGAVAGA